MVKQLAVYSKNLQGYGVCLCTLFADALCTEKAYEPYFMCLAAQCYSWFEDGGYS